MTIDVSQLVLFGIFTSALHWLVARSEVARPLWSRARGWLAALLSCAGCSGFWIGSVLGGTGLTTPLTLDVSPILYVDVALRALAHGILGVFVTPVFEGLLLWGLRESALQDDNKPDDVGAVPEPVAQSHSSVITPVSNPSRR